MHLRSRTCKLQVGRETSVLTTLAASTSSSETEYLLPVLRCAALQGPMNRSRCTRSTAEVMHKCRDMRTVRDFLANDDDDERQRQPSKTSDMTKISGKLSWYPVVQWFPNSTNYKYHYNQNKMFVVFRVSCGLC